MEENLTNNLSICNYCEAVKDDTLLYSTGRNFAGSGIIDILQTVTQLKIPNTIPIKLCNMCASLLLSSTCVISKASEMVSKHMPSSNKNQNNDAPNGAGEIQNREAKGKQLKTAESNRLLKKNVGDKENTGNGTQSTAIKSSPGSKSGSKKLVPTSGNVKNLAAKAKETLESNALTTKVANSPRKPSAKMTSTLLPEPPASKSHQSKKDEDSLQDAIKLTPAMDSNRQDKKFVQMFGTNGDKESSSDEDDEDANVMVEVGATGNDKGYVCKLCDFASPYPTTMKRHLKQVHGQKRPRVFSCTKCSKSFGLKNSLETHLLKHQAPEVNADDATRDPQLAVLTALKPKPKMIETLVDSVCSFGVNKVMSSTPKAIAETPQTPQNVQKIQCEMCKDVFNVIKDLQEHLKNVHNIDRPKPFKCDNCDSYFMHKSTMDRHYKKKHMTDDVMTPLKKITARRSTVAEALNVSQKLESNLPPSNKEPARVVSRRKTFAIDMQEVENVASIGIEINATSKSPKKLQPPSNLNNEPHVSVSPEPGKKANEKHKLTPSMQNGESIDNVIDNNNAVKESIEMQSLNIATNGSAKKKQKCVDFSLQQEAGVGLNACKKLKLEMINEIPEPDIIDLMDEVNPNVVPHTREMQDSPSVEANFTCDMCSKVFSTVKRLDMHVYKKHTLKLSCSNCENVYTTKSGYVKHFTVCAPANGALPCGVKLCNKLFYTPKFLSSHLTKKHKIED